ncbi:hypothetical protein PVA98_13440, partial [Achromobacter xylosoxidans]|nr:hypothetical protein [Achromobacter xylosoxidans]
MAPPRLAQVDALRGFALLGILVVNIGVFASPFYANGIADPAFSSRADLAVRWLVAWLFETKFYLLFSFLFGYSFTLQMAAAERGGGGGAPPGGGPPGGGGGGGAGAPRGGAPPGVLKKKTP